MHPFGAGIEVQVAQRILDCGVQGGCSTVVAQVGWFRQAAKAVTSDCPTNKILGHHWARRSSARLGNAFDVPLRILTPLHRFSKHSESTPPPQSRFVSPPMEALAAISLVAAVAQFVDYSHRLLSSTAEIVQSADGATAEALKTECIVSHVQQLSEALATPSAPEPSGATIPETEAAALRDLASLCRDECTALLYAVRSVKATGSGRSYYGSFKAALKNAIGAKKLATMQTTIGMAQAAISLQTQRIIG